jgi:protein gp37
MSQHTDIEWADSSVNPTTGCDGCELWKVGVGGPCYAGNLHEGRLAKAFPDLYAPKFDEVRLVPGRMAKAASWPDLRGKARPDKPWLDGLPRLIFVADLGDLFSKAVPFEFIKEEVIDVAGSKKGLRHIWMLLTKQPHRMAEFARWLVLRGNLWPENVWAGTSITTNRTLARLKWLLDVPATYRYLSVEPQFERVDLRLVETSQDGPDESPYERLTTAGQGLSLVIQGGESDQGKQRGRPFDLSWARQIRDECKASGISYFLKQIGSTPHEGQTALALKDHHGGNWSEWSPDLRVREMPVPRETAPAGRLF